MNKPKLIQSTPQSLFKLKSFSLLSLLCLTLLTPSLVYACPPQENCDYELPTGWVVETGTASFDTSTPNLLSILASDGTVIRFASSSLGRLATLKITQPSSNSNLLIKDESGVSSDINGTLLSNANLIWSNLSGINIGSTAHIQANSFIASTLAISNADFLANKLNFQRPDNKTSFIHNEGEIIATGQNGYVALLSDVVKNGGKVEATLGSVVIASSRKASLSLDPNGLMNIVVDEGTKASLEPSIENTSSALIQARQVTLTAKSLDTTFKSLIVNKGRMEATKLIEKDGKLLLVADNIEVEGDLKAKTTELEATNDIRVTGNLNVTGDLKLKADSDHDGKGKITQEASSKISTTGDLTLIASETSTLSNLSVGGTLSYLASTPGAIYKEASTSQVQAQSLLIGENTTLEAMSSVLPGAEGVSQRVDFFLTKDWTNLGSFKASDSSVSFESSLDSFISGNNTFHDFKIETKLPLGETYHKKVTFQAGSTQEFTGTLTLEGSSTNLLNIQSSDLQVPVNVSILGDYKIDFINLQGMTHTLNHGPPVQIFHSEKSQVSGFYFVPESLTVLTPSGYKDLSQIQVGDEVLSLSPTGQTTTNTVQEVSTLKEGVFYYINGEYKFSSDQSIWSNNRVVHVSELTPGDTIYTSEGQAIEVKSLQRVEESSNWTRLVLSGDHSYVSGGLLLHNASRYWVGGGSSTNWNAVGNTNWGSASNTQDNSSVPGSSDDVIFDGVGTGASNSTVSATITVKSVDFTNYTNTLTMNAVLTVAGNVTLGSGMTIAGASGLTTSSTSTLTSNGKIWPNALTIGSSSTVTLSDNWTVGSFSFGNFNSTLNGNTLYVGGDLTFTGTVNATLGGTTSIVLNGTGTWSGFALLSNPLTINTAGTITISGAVYYGGTGFVYTAGSVVTAGSTFTISGSNTLPSAITWNNLTIGNITLTLDGDTTLNGSLAVGNVNANLNGHKLYVGGDFAFSGGVFATLMGTTNIVFNGTGTWSSSGGVVSNNITINTAGTFTVSGTVYYNTGGKAYTAGTVTTVGSTLVSSAATTFNTNGMSWNNVTMNGNNVTYTLLSDMAVGGNLYVGGSGDGLATTVNGFNLSVGGNLTVASGGNGGNPVTGTTTIVLNGTGTWSSSGSGTLRNNLTINTAGTITFGTILYNTGTFTYTAGTVVTAGSNVTIGKIANDLPTGITTWNNLTLNGASATYTLPSNYVFNGSLSLTGSNSTYTLQGDLSVPGNLLVGGAGDGFAITINGFSLSTAGNLTVASGGNGGNPVTGTTTIVLNGTGTWSSSGSGTLRNNLTINTAGTITISGSDRYNTGTLTYTAGTVTTAGSTLFLTGSSTLNTNGISWNNVTFSNGTTQTLSSDLTVNGTLTQGTASITGAGGLVLGTNSAWTGSGTSSLGGGLTLGSSMTNSYTGNITFTSTSGTKTLTSNGITLNSNLTFNGIGGTWQLGDNLTLGTNNLTITNGTLDASGSNYTITLGGNWSNSGTFTARNGAVIFNGVNQSISGTNTFYDLTKSETTNDSTNSTWTFPASTTTTVTHTWTVDGLDSNDKILLVSSSPATRWNINAASTVIDNATVTDSNNTSGTLINKYSDNTVTDGGNDLNWAFSTNSAFTWIGTTSTTWSTNANWLGGTTPGSSDDAVFNGSVSNNNATLTGTTTIKSVTFATYTGTLTMNAALTVAGDVTLGSGMTIAGASALVLSTATTATLTSNGKTWPNQFYINGVGNGTFTYTLADDWTVGSFRFDPQGNGSTTLNGHTMYIGGDFLINGNSNGGAQLLGTTNFVLNGTGTWSSGNSNSYVTNNLTINTSGTITVSGAVGYDLGTLTYLAGTVNTAGSTLIIGALTTSGTTTLDTNGISWNNLSFFSNGGTLTLASNTTLTGNFAAGAHGNNATTLNGSTLNVGGNLTIGIDGTGWLLQGTTNIVLNGTGTWSDNGGASTAQLRNNLTINTLGTITVSGTVYYNTGTLTYTAGTVATAGSTLVSSTATTFNTNGMSWNNVTMSGAVTYTLSSDMTVAGNLNVGGTAGNTTINGSTLYIGGNFANNVNVGGNSLGVISGSTVIVLNGTGSWSQVATNQTNSGLFNPLTINTSGTITISGTVGYRGSAFTYTGGTVATAGSTVYFYTSTSTSQTLPQITWNNLTLWGPSDGGTNVYTLTADATVNGKLEFDNYQYVVTLNGFSINVAGNLNVSSGGNASGVVNGTTNIVMNGTGTWSHTQGSGLSVLRNNLTINTAGTVTISGTVGYNTGTLAYTAGTVTTAGSTLSVAASTTLNTNGITWNNVTFSNGTTQTLSSDLTVNGTLSQGTATITGAGGLVLGTNSTWSGSGSSSLGGSLTLGSSMTNLYTGAITFTATSGTKTITSNGITLASDITFNGVGGTWQLADALLTGSTKTLTLTNGTFNANNQNLSLGLFSSSNANTRTLTMGSGTWTLTGNNATIWNTSTDTNLTMNLGNAVVSSYAGAVGTRTFSVGATESKAPSFNITAGSDTVTVGTAAGSLNFTGFSGTLTNSTRTLFGDLTLSGGMTLSSGNNITTFGATSGTKTLTTSGKTLDFPLTFNGVGGTFQLGDALTLGSTRTLSVTNGTLTQGARAITTGALTINGGTFTGGSQALDVNGNVTLSSGSFTAPSGAFTVSGNWTKSGGTFNPGTYTVLLDGADQTLDGSTTFYNLTKTVSTARTLNFTQGTTQTVLNALDLEGSSNNLLSLRSSLDGSTWNIDPQGTRTVSYLDVKDSTNINSTLINGIGFNLTDSGHNTGWLFRITPPSLLTQAVLEAYASRLTNDLLRLFMPVTPAYADEVHPSSSSAVPVRAFAHIDNLLIHKYDTGLSPFKMFIIELRLPPQPAQEHSKKLHPLNSSVTS